jgi:hypothetical protein
MRTIFFAGLLIALVVAEVRDARADVTAAARAFANGQSAQLDGDYDRAAQSFELAFSIAPSKEALRSAIRTRQLSKQLARAATLAEVLLTKYPGDAASVRLANEVISEATPKLGRLAVTCSASCTVAVDGLAVSLQAATGHVVYVPAGSQQLEITFESGQAITRGLEIEPGRSVDVPVEAPVVETPAPQPPTPPAAPPEAPRVIVRQPAVSKAPSGLSPIVAFSGAIVTLGLVSVGVWSGLETNKAYDAYVAKPTSQGWKDGRAMQLRTNLWFAGAAVAGVSTALVAAFWTRWSDASDAHTPAIGIAPTSDGVAMSWAHAF